MRFMVWTAEGAPVSQLCESGVYRTEEDAQRELADMGPAYSLRPSLVGVEVATGFGRVDHNVLSSLEAWQLDVIAAHVAELTNEQAARFKTYRASRQPQETVPAEELTRLPLIARSPNDQVPFYVYVSQSGTHFLGYERDGRVTISDEWFPLNDEPLAYLTSQNWTIERETVRLAPTWNAAASIIAAALVHGTPKGRELARAELAAMAMILDDLNAGASVAEARSAYEGESGAVYLLRGQSIDGTVWHTGGSGWTNAHGFAHAYRTRAGAEGARTEEQAASDGRELDAKIGRMSVVTLTEAEWADVQERDYAAAEAAQADDVDPLEELTFSRAEWQEIDSALCLAGGLHIETAESGEFRHDRKSAKESAALCRKLAERIGRTLSDAR
jgi:hypothetical protein